MSLSACHLGALTPSPTVDMNRWLLAVCSLFLNEPETNVPSWHACNVLRRLTCMFPAASASEGSLRALSGGTSWCEETRENSRCVHSTSWPQEHALSSEAEANFRNPELQSGRAEGADSEAWEREGEVQRPAHEAERRSARLPRLLQLHSDTCVQANDRAEREKRAAPS